MNVAIVTSGSGAGQATVQSNAVVTAVAAVPLSISKRVAPSGPVAPGSTLRYTLRFENLSGQDLTGVVLTDPLDPELVSASGLTTGAISSLGSVPAQAAASGAYDPSSREVTWSLPLVPDGFIGELSFDATLSPAAPSEAIVRNSFTARSDQDPNGVLSAEVTSLVLGPSLSLAMSATRDRIEVGEVAGFRLQVSNRDPAMDLSGTVIHVSLPEGFRYREGSYRLDGGRGGRASPSSDGARLDLRVGALASGESLAASFVGIAGAGAREGEVRAEARAEARTPSNLRVRSPGVTVKLHVIRGNLAMEGILAGRVFADLDGDGRPSPGDPAVPGVRLFLEDGTQVITDVAGKYHVEGIRPGLHVLKIDPDTLPQGVRAEGISVRSSGTPGVQFVDLRASELFKANFPLAGDEEAPMGLSVNLTAPGEETPPARPPVLLASALFEPGSDTLRPSAQGHVEAFAQMLREMGTGAEGFTVSEASDASTVLGRARARAFDEALRGALGAARRPRLAGGQARDPASSVIPASTGPEPAAAGEYATEDLLRRLPSGVYILSPRDGDVVDSERVSVEVAFPSDSEARLSVGGKEVSEEKIGVRMETSLSGMRLVRYVGVDLRTGENVISLETRRGEAGAAGAELRVDRVGPPAVILIRGESGTQPADGRTPGRAVIEVRDARGHPVTDGTTVSVEAAEGTILGSDGDPVSDGFQVKTRSGAARVRLSPASTAESRALSARAGDAEGEGEIRFGTFLRDWVVAGVGEAGWSGNGAGAGESFGDLSGSPDATGKLALYAKGRVGEKSLMSVSYDSSRARDESALFRVQDPSEMFPVYGDSSLQSYDLQSQGKLALRWERERSMAMLGDFRTGLTAAELARYDRPLTGAFTRIETPKITAQAFGATTPQTSVRDAMPAEGSSGPYRLSRRPIVAYSEQVTLEVRDRYHTDRVLASSPQSRFTDYDIDYASGTILFRSPVAAEDLGFNPVTIVVTYELVDSSGTNLAAGGRLGYRPMERLELGATAIREGRGDGDLTIAGADVTVRPWAGAAITAEVASAITPGSSASAFALRFTAPAGPSATLSAYVRDVPADYSNPSMTGVSEIGTHKEGLEVRGSLPDGSRIVGEAFRQEQSVLGTQQDSAGLSWQKPAGKLTYETGGRALSGTTEAGGENGGSGLLRAGIRAQMTRRLDASLFRQEVVAGETVSGYPTRTELGGGYKISDHVRAFLKHEVDQGDIRTTQRDHIGLEGHLGENTTLESRYALEDAVSGSRGYALVGVKTRFSINDLWTADLRTERAETVSGLGGSDFTSLSAGAEYLPGALKFANRYEVRFGEQETRHMMTAAGAIKLTPDLVFFARNRLLLSQPDLGPDRLDADGLMGLAYRPLDSDRWNWLGRIEALHGETLPGGGTTSVGSTSARGLLGVFELNFQPVDKLHFLGRYAGRSSRDALDGAEARSYTELWEGRVMADVGKRVTAGVAGRLLRQPSTETTLTGAGLESGFLVARDLWLVAGYNVTGFSDQKFPDGDRRSRGPFVSLRFKFDESLFAGLGHRGGGEPRLAAGEPGARGGPEGR